MAITTKLELRQSHSLVMTPQLQQAIKLLQLSNMELATFVEAELERNPLLERADTEEAGGAAPEAAAEPLTASAKEEADGEATSATGESDAVEGDDGEGVDLNSGSSRSEDLDAEPQDVFPDAESFSPGALKDSGWATLGQGSRANLDEESNLEAYVAEERTLRNHLTEQLVLAFADPAQRLIGHHLIDMTDEAGYLRGDLESVAELLGAPLELVEATLEVMQGFEPCGVFARDLRECLMLQLKERDRCDPAMAALVQNLQLLAVHDLAALKRAARVSDEDLMDMIQEVKRLNPKPGLKYGSAPSQPIVPDVLVRALPDGSFHVELNSETLPRVLINQSYYATVCKSATRKEDKSYLVDCLQTANWLVKSLDQRARTILKVAQEIVRQQDGFLTYGVRHLRPLNLKTVADAISMHEFDGEPRHRQQIHGHQSRPVRAEIFLHLGDRGDQRRRRAFVRSRARPHPLHDRGRARKRRALRRQDRGKIERRRRRYRSPHGGEIPRSATNPLFGAAPAAEAHGPGREPVTGA